jgi:Flp pilus assembly pilin Flp
LKGTHVIVRLIRDDQGQDLIEYVLLGSFIAILALAGVSSLGTNLNNWYSKVASWAAQQANQVP